MKQREALAAQQPETSSPQQQPTPQLPNQARLGNAAVQEMLFGEEAPTPSLTADVGGGGQAAGVPGGAPPAAPPPDAPAATAPAPGTASTASFATPAAADAGGEPTLEQAGALALIDAALSSLLQDSDDSIRVQRDAAERGAQDGLSHIATAGQALDAELGTIFASGRGALDALFAEAGAQLAQHSDTAQQEVGARVEGTRSSTVAAIDGGATTLQARLQAAPAEADAALADVDPSAPIQSAKAQIDSSAAAIGGRYGGDGGAEVRASVADVAGASKRDLEVSAGDVCDEVDQVVPALQAVWTQEAAAAGQEVSAIRATAEQTLSTGGADAQAAIAQQADGARGEVSAAQGEASRSLDDSAQRARQDSAAARQEAEGAVREELAHEHAELQQLSEGIHQATQAARADLAAEVDGGADGQALQAALDEQLGGQHAALEKSLDAREQEATAARASQAEGFDVLAGEAADAATCALDDGLDQAEGQADTVVSGFADSATDAIDQVEQQLCEVGGGAGEAIDELNVCVDEGIDEQICTVSDGLQQAQPDIQSGADQSAQQTTTNMDSAAQEANKGWLEKAWDAVSGFVADIVNGFAAWLDSVWSPLGWVFKQVVNLVSGFVWGEPWFTDVWGAELIAFIGDIFAGVLVIGDIRDLIKYWIVYPLTGKGPWWLLLILGIISLVGLIPLYGDGIKVILKGIFRAFFKKLLKEGAEEVLERLAKILGEKVAREFIETFGEKAAQELVEELGEEALKELVEKLGMQGLKELTEAFGTQGLKELVEKLGAQGLKDLSEKLGSQGLKELTEALGVDAVGELAETLGASGLKGLVDEFGAQGLKGLVDEFGAQGLKGLVETFGAQGLKELTETFGQQGLKDLLAELGEQGLKELVDDIGAAGVRALTDKLGSAGLKKLVAELGTATLGKLYKGMDGSTLHKVGLLDSIDRVGGIDAFVTLVKRDGADAVITYGAEGLQKFGKATLDAAAGLGACIMPSLKKLQKKWKHAVDFGITTPWKAKDTAAHQAFKTELDTVISDATSVFVGPYHGTADAFHYFKDGLVVITDAAGNFISGWGNALGKKAGIEAVTPPNANKYIRAR